MHPVAGVGLAAGLQEAEFAGAVEVDLDWDMAKKKILANFLSSSLQQVTVKFPGSVKSVRSAGLPLSIKPSPLGQAYRIITLPADKQISIEIELK